jgi:hypothetical protein
VSRRLEEIARRKQILIEQCARQRDELATVFRRIRSPFALDGLASTIARALKSHPVAVAGISSLLAGGYAGKLFKMASKGLALWRLIRPIWFWWKKAR